MSVAKLYSVHGGHLPQTADADLVALLEDMLERAKSGDLEAIGYAAISSNKDIGTGWTGVAGTKHLMTSAISILQHRYTEALQSDD